MKNFPEKYRQIIRYCFGVYLLFIFILPACGQTEKAPELIPKTPEVLLFERYGNIPVNQYTGIHNTSIPCYNLKIGDKNFSIDLTYNSGGIKVTDEATWVGLGWNLSALGSISVEPIGGADDPYYQPSENSYSDVINYPHGVTPGYPKMFQGRGYISLSLPGSCPGTIEGGAPPGMVVIPDHDIVSGNFTFGTSERDIYHVKMLGKSFKFFVKPLTNEIVFMGEKYPYKIQKNNTNWEITDDQGYRFFFNENENYTVAGAAVGINTWHLTHIVYQGKVLLRAVYDSYHITLLPTINDVLNFNKEGYRPNTEYGSRSITRNISHINSFTAKYPKYIVTNLDSVLFETESRIDYRGGAALRAMKVFAIGNGELVKHLEFKKSYFTGEGIGSDESTLDFVTKRLRLDSVLIYHQNSTPQSYSFSYYGNVPYKTSFSQDFWGFYNGQENFDTYTHIGQTSPFFSNRRTLSPKPSSLVFEENVPEKYWAEQGADRGVSESFVAGGSLKSITYPTGGSTVFTYEPHEIGNATYVKAGTSLYNTVRKVIMNNGNPSFGPSYIEFNLTEQKKATLKVTIKGTSFNVDQMGAFNFTLVTNAGTSSARIKSYSIKTEEQRQAFIANKSVIFEEDVILDPGLNILVSNVASMPYQGYDFYNGVRAELTFVETNFDKTYPSYVGGIRLKDISNFDADDVLTDKTEYEYVDENNITSGILVQPLKSYISKSYLNVDLRTVSNPPDFTYQEAVRKDEAYDHFSSSNLNSFTNTYSRSYVGYSRVTKSRRNYKNDSESIVEISYFHNTPVSGFYHVRFFPNDKVIHAMNGLLYEKILVNNQLDTVLVEDYQYAIENVNFFPVNIAILDRYIGPRRVHACMLNQILMGKQFSVAVYEYTNFNVQLLSKKTKGLYGGNNTTLEEEVYQYSPFNYQLSNIMKASSNGHSESIFIKYAQDFSSSNEVALIANNMISIPIEKYTIVNGLQKNYYKINYTPWLGLYMMLPGQVYEKDKAGNLILASDFSEYDDYGNLLEMNKKGLPRTVYLWGYKHQYPIAKIENAAYTEVFAVLGQATINSLNAANVSDATITDAMARLRNDPKMAKAQVTSYTYKPLVGMTSMTDPRGITEYYQYDGFQRLKDVLDFDKNILQNYRYHYRP